MEWSISPLKPSLVLVRAPVNHMGPVKQFGTIYLDTWDRSDRQRNLTRTGEPHGMEWSISPLKPSLVLVRAPVNHMGQVKQFGTIYLDTWDRSDRQRNLTRDRWNNTGPVTFCLEWSRFSKETYTG
jgi:hypothetical protein